MKNRAIVTLLTIIAVLLGANLLIATSGTTWAQDRGRQPERGPQQPERPVRPGQPERPVRPQVERQPRCVGITSVGDTIILAFEDGSIDRRSVPTAR